MRTECWRITGNNFHFGEQGLGQEETMVNFPSDSLFAALLARLAALKGGQYVEQFIQPFLSGDPPFLLTSTFPLAGEIRFFPAPARWWGGQTTPGLRVKDIKKIAFISEGLFRQMIAGKPLNELYTQAVVYQGKQVVANSSEVQKLPPEIQLQGSVIWDIEPRVRVTIGRSAPASTPYYTGQVTFAKDCGLWFGVHWLKADPVVKDLLDQLLADLAIVGLGGERSVGFGACKIEPMGEIELPPAGSGPWISISRYLPGPAEMGALVQPYAAYRLKHVTGWLSSTTQPAQRRRAVNLLAEGAVLGPLDTPTPGQVVDIRPRYVTETSPFDHPVFRSGLAFAVGIQGVTV